MWRQGRGLGLAPTTTLGCFHCRHSPNSLSPGSTAGLVQTRPHGQQGASSMQRLGKLLGHFQLHAQRSVASWWAVRRGAEVSPSPFLCREAGGKSAGAASHLGLEMGPRPGPSLLNYTQGQGPSYVFAQALGAALSVTGPT